MAYRGVMDDVRRALKGERPKRMPFFALSEEMDVRLAGLQYEEYDHDAKAMAKVVSHAQKLFDEYVNSIGRLGLFSEQYDPDKRQGTGNFPQTYSHIGLINTASLLAR